MSRKHDDIVRVAIIKAVEVFKEIVVRNGCAVKKEDDICETKDDICETKDEHFKEYSQTITRYWPDTSEDLIASFYRYSFPIRFKKAGYDWSKKSAHQAALEAMAEFGE